MVHFIVSTALSCWHLVEILIPCHPKQRRGALPTFPTRAFPPPRVLNLSLVTVVPPGPSLKGILCRQGQGLCVCSSFFHKILDIMVFFPLRLAGKKEISVVLVCGRVVGLGHGDWHCGGKNKVQHFESDSVVYVWCCFLPLF